MKIGEVNGNTIEGVCEWVQEVKSLPSTQFIEYLSNFKHWEWQRIDDLSPISPILDRIDELLNQALQEGNHQLLTFLLEKTQILLKSATSKSLYNSVDELLLILDMPDWEIVYKALQVFHVLVNRITPTIKTTKAHSNSVLANKLYAIGLGPTLNNPNPLSLQMLCSEENIQPLKFQYLSGEELIETEENVPEHLKYIWQNRKRTNQVIGNKEQRQLAASCQLLALSVLLQMSPDFHMIQDFCRSLPELWLLPSLSELLRMQVSSSIHIQVVYLLSAILVMMEGQTNRHEPSQSQLITATHNLLAAWQQHGLMQSLLRDIVYPSPAMITFETSRNPEFVSSILHLSSIIADYKFRVDSSHVHGMTCSLLLLLKLPEHNTYSFMMESIARGVRILSVLISHNIDMFREIDGMSTVLRLLNHELVINAEPVDCFYEHSSDIVPSPAVRSYLVRTLLRILKIALNKLETVPGVSHNEIRTIIDSGLMTSLRKNFEKQKFDIYEPSLQLLSIMVNDNPHLVNEFLSDGTIVALFNSLETQLPAQPKLMGILARFLCATALNTEGIRIIENFNTIPRLLQGLGSYENSVLSNEVAIGVGESLQELMTLVPGLRDKTVDGCIQMVSTMQFCNLSAKESFFTQLTNIAKLLGMLFNYSNDLIRGFIDKGGLDGFFAIFRLPILPLTYNNEFHSALVCFKSIPMNLTLIVLSKILAILNQNLSKLEEFIGPLNLAKDFSSVPENKHDEFMHVLTSIDSFADMTRIVCQYGTGISNIISDLCVTLVQLSHFMRLLIAEQARLSPFSKPNEKKTEKFNMPIDISDIENAALKTYDENFYFTCQLSVRRLFRFATRISAAKNRNNISEDSSLKISKTMGELIAGLAKLLNLDEPSQSKAYYYCLQLSDILKILLHDQGSSPSTIWAFFQAGGVDHLIIFIKQLNAISISLHKQKDLPYDLVNSLQILWNLCGKAVEGLANGKYQNNVSNNLVLKALGVASAKHVFRKMQTLAIDCIKELNYLEIGVLSTAFAKSVLEVMKQVLEQPHEHDLSPPRFNDQAAARPIGEMGLNEALERHLYMQPGSSNYHHLRDSRHHHSDFSNLPAAPVIENPHQILIDYLPAISPLASSVADLLLKLCNKSNSQGPEIALMLLSLIGKLTKDLLGVNTLYDVTLGMSSLQPVEIEADFSQLAAAIQTLSFLSAKSNDILEFVRQNNFTEHALNFILAANADSRKGNHDWMAPLFSILDTLVRICNAGSFEMVEAISKFLKSTHETKSKLAQTEVFSLLTLLISLTSDPSYAKSFVDNDALFSLLTISVISPEPKVRGLSTTYFNFLKQISEDPYILQSIFEIAIKGALIDTPSLDNFMKNFRSQVLRSKEIFQRAFENVCSCFKRDNKVYVEERKEREEISAQRWDVVTPIANALVEAVNAEQAGNTELLLQSEQIMSLLADLIQTYPLMISSLIPLNIKGVKSASSHKHSRRFFTLLVRNYIQKPHVKLLRALTFKQAYRQPNTPVAHIFNNSICSNNIPVLKARKRIFTEMKEMLAEESKKNWYDNEKSMSTIKNIAITIMQLLREPAKAPFTRNNPAEIARFLVSDQLNMVRLLSDCTKGVKLSFKKAGSILNLLLAPLELLTRYNINFTLHLARHQTHELEEVVDENPEDEDMPKYDVYPLEEQEFEEGDIDEDEGEGEEEEEEGSELSLNSGTEESESQEELEIGEVEGMEDHEEDEDADLIEEESDEVEDEELLDDIVIENRNTDAFWADDFEEEEEDPAREGWMQARPTDLTHTERHLLEQGAFGAEVDDIHPGILFQTSNHSPNHFREINEEGPIMQLIRDFDNPNEEFLQVLLHRNHHTGEAMPIRPPDFNRAREAESTISELTTIFSQNALIAQEVSQKEASESQPVQQLNFDMEVEEEIPAQVPQEREVDIEHIPQERMREEVQINLPEGIDPAFLDALPPDIREEVLAQYRHAEPQPQEIEANISEEFLNALPPEIRNEVILQNQPQIGQAAEMDNATFIASLAPDLRREVLLGVSEEMMLSLPPELAAEARLLQDRAIQQRHNFIIERQIPQQRHNPISQEEGKAISDIVADEKLSNSLIQVEDNFLELLLKALYLVSPINRDILAFLLLNLSAHQLSRQKILDGLVCILLQLSPRREFPPRQLYGSDSFMGNFSQAYAIVSGRILDLLQYLTKMNPRVASDLTNQSKHRLNIVKSFKGNEEVKAFQSLITLMDQGLYRTSSTHLTPLINLIVAVIEKQENDIQALDEFAITQICSLLSYESLNEVTVKTVVELVTKLAKNENNKAQIQEALTREIRALGEEIAGNLRRVETSPNGQRELQLLRLYKVLNSVSGNVEGLEYLWDPLTDALSVITERDTNLSSTTSPTLSKLLPIIEIFFISHINSALGERFQSFCDKNRKVLNLLVKQNPSLLNDTFNSLVTRFPSLLDFENKRSFFRSEIRKMRPERGYDTIRLNVRRNEVFMDSFHQLKVRTPAEMYGKLRVQFFGEEGVDAGGLTREWYGLLAREMFNPNYALFIPSANGVLFQPNPLSYVNAEHLQFFKFVGRIIGKALCDGYALDVYFTRSFYKHILGQEVNYQDMEDIDPEFYKNLKFLLDISLTENEFHEYYFAYEEEEFGKLIIKELIPNGAQIRVTEDNKMEYIKLLCSMKTTKNIEEQINAFLEGFYEMVPKELIAIFDSKELELLISGLPDIDLEDLRANTEYHNYTRDSQAIRWLWEVLYEFSQEERAEFLQFVTGSSKVPLEGFKALAGMSGPQKFQIHKSFTTVDRLPTAHTCMNQLDLPEYTSKDMVYSRIKLAISEGKEGFGFM